jgi:CubicO group peptidase (beta-lactamase class C family)
MITRWILFPALLLTFFACSPPAVQEVEAPPFNQTLVRSFLDSAVSEGRVAGAVALVARGNEILSFDAVGMADREAGTPMKKDTLFRIASMTKPVTSVAVMMLFDEGKLTLEDPASKFLPELGSLRVLKGDGSRDTVDAAREITVRDLLTHTSGIIYEFIAIEPLATMYGEAGISNGLIETDGTIADFVKELGELPLLHQPSERWTYGQSTDVLGRLVEVVSGQGLDAFLRDRIFLPLGMKDTSFFPPEDQKGRMAVVYDWSEAEGLRRLPDEPIVQGHLKYSTTFHFKGPRTFFSGGGGLASTVPDYLRFAQMLRNGGELDSVRILKPETLALMTQNHIGDLKMGLDLGLPDPLRFGLGFSVKTVADEQGGRGTFGWAGFYHTLFWIDPENDLIGIFMSQLRLPEGKDLQGEFQRAVYEALPDGSREATTLAQ